jgi:hypothetical protein
MPARYCLLKQLYRRARVHSELDMTRMPHSRDRTETVYPKGSGLLALAAAWLNMADQVDYLIRRAVLSQLVPALYPAAHRSGVETSPPAVSFNGYCEPSAVLQSENHRKCAAIECDAGFRGFADRLGSGLAEADVPGPLIDRLGIRKSSASQERKVHPVSGITNRGIANHFDSGSARGIGEGLTLVVVS